MVGLFFRNSLRVESVSSSSVGKVLNGQHWVAEEQVGTGVMHDRSDPFSHLRVVTVDAAVEAGGLLLLKGTEIKPLIAVG